MKKVQLFELVSSEFQHVPGAGSLSLVNMYRMTDGSTVKLTAQAMHQLDFSKFDINIFALKQNEDGTWRYVGDRPHPDWRKMSVDEYIQRGKPEILTVFGNWGQILTINQRLRDEVNKRLPAWLQSTDIPKDLAVCA